MAPARRVAAIVPLLLAVALAGALIGGPAAASAATYAGTLTIGTGERLVGDLAAVDTAAPARVRAQISGKARTATVALSTTCCRSDAMLLRDAGRIPGTPVVLTRPLSASERRSFSERLLWLDADLLVAQAGHPACRKGVSLARARTILRGALPAETRVYAPAAAAGKGRQVLFGLPSTGPRDRVYGRSVRLLDEQAAITAVARDPKALAGVAWSAARAALAAGRICSLPIDGITAGESVLWDRIYPATIHATFAVSRRAPAATAWVRRWYLDDFLRSARTRTLLHAVRDRNRLLPG